MSRIVVIPVDGTPHGLEAVRQVAREARGTALRVELVNVLPALHRHISEWVGPAEREAWRAERAKHALEPARRVLAEAGIECGITAAIGPVPQVVAALAQRVHADEIVLSSRRQSPVSRMLGGSLSSRLLGCSPVPVRIVPSAARFPLDRIAVPAGLGLGVAAALAAMGD